jgi:hypothetical protein
MCLSYTQTKKTINVRRLALSLDERVPEQTVYLPRGTEAVTLQHLNLLHL